MGNIVVVWSAESINMDKFSAFGKNISSAFNTTVSPFVQRSQQQLKEQFGSVEDKTQLPADYVELEKRVDALKQVHQKLLAVTNQYQNEAYDYSPNIREIEAKEDDFVSQVEEAQG